MKVYCSGPMTGAVNHNFEEFDRTTEFMISKGLTRDQIINPADIDRASGYDGSYEPTRQEAREFLLRDLIALATATHIALMPGWDHSNGAIAELTFARAIGLEIWQVDWRRNIFGPASHELLTDVVREGNEALTRNDDMLDLSTLPGPVAQAIRMISSTFTRKNADYAEDGDWRSNFDDIAHQMGITAVEAADTLIAVKQARMRSLKANAREPGNEAVLDTRLDRTVYSVLSLALDLDDAERACEC